MTTEERQLGVVELITSELEIAGMTVRGFHNLLRDYFEGEGETLAALQEIDRLEDESNRFQRRLEVQLIQSSDPWASDYGVLSDSIDKIASDVEDAADFLVLTHPRIPSRLVEPLLEIGEVTVRAYENLQQAWEASRADPASVLEHTHRVNDCEEMVDQLLWNATRQIFDGKSKLSQKLHLKRLFDLSEMVSNRIEQAAHRLECIAFKTTPNNPSTP